MDLVFGAEPSFRLNYVKIIMYSVLPFLIYLISLIYWKIHGLIANMNHEDVGDRVNATTIIVAFLFYPTIVKVIAQSMNCIVIDEENRLYSDLEEKCYTGTHLWIVVLVSGPALMAWAVGIPVYALTKLRTNLKHLEKIRQRTEST